MRIKMVYISEDGKQFETQQDCEKYERKIFTEDKLVELSCYDLKYDCLMLEDVEDIGVFLKEGRDWLKPFAEEIWNGD